MKTLKKQIRPITLLLAFVMLFQGCTVYKSVPITIEQATKEEQQVKILTKNNVKLKFKRIIVENEKLYGVRKVDGIDVNLVLDRNSIDTIRAKDKTLSTILSIGGTVIIVGGLIAIAAASSIGSFGGNFYGIY